ncbi:sensor histidine kinase [Desulfobulbus oligotrophicus]|jgi:two-component system nitrogen regulation sensor histidine kinase NtrY|uniref:histidine kinase n=1 Tax=Desulfobulbus oligotrophicus TaxID=1909699 RepID=A0A7T5VF11_9BACT|nr:ATP-binding protein [Desulfobulbus oligotrophicus]MDY0391410.1 ATP-binding protein [Desulfobulbus oligotrophicus]QQG66687.1 HAMP domain-containing protein [Desulfobulbus oligotrophicus]
MLTADQKKKKQRLVRLVIVFCILLIPLLGYVQRGLLTGQFNLPISSTILIFALININGLLLLLMLYLVLRNLVELVFERRQNILGARLRTRLVICFISLSFIPTAILFFVALRFISTSMDYWFNAQIEESLQASVHLSQTIIHDSGKQAEYTGRQLATILESGTVNLNDLPALERFLSNIIAISTEGAPDSLLLLNSRHQPLLTLVGPRLQGVPYPDPPSEALRFATVANRSEVVTHKTIAGELIEAIVPVQISRTPPQTWFLITSVLIPASRLDAMHSISSGTTDYQQLIMLKAPIKFSLIIILLIITLLILFGAIWFGFFIARSLTGPIKKLAEATKRVADGDMDFIVEKEADDEMGMLIDSFNSMTSEILASNRQLARAHLALQDSNETSEQRRRYLETILENVAAGVIALDENNRITTINRFAEELLAVDPTDFLGKDFHTALPKQHVLIVENFLTELQTTGKATIERHLRVTIRKGETLSLQVNITRMVDDRQNPIGFVIVFDNLTNLEKAQRLAAWQEVARRIAHEIKNPLTPIQLSAQRLRKRYLETISDNRDIFDKCTATIVNQVDEIKKMVSEFSDFARMPKLRKERNNLTSMIHEVVVMYQEAHKQLHITSNIAPDVPAFLFDAVQIKRVLINLLDNAVAMLGDTGSITVTLSYDDPEQKARLEVIDDGPGISSDIKLRIFEPYYSTRKSGTGLGLTIAHTIVSEHGGTIRVHDNMPTGSVFTVELPVEN